MVAQEVILLYIILGISLGILAGIRKVYVLERRIRELEIRMLGKVTKKRKRK